MGSEAACRCRRSGPGGRGGGGACGPAARSFLRPHQEGDVPGIDRFAGGERPRRAAPQLREQRPQLVDDEVLRDLLVVDAERRQEVLLVAEVAERAVAEVVEQAGGAQGLLDQRQRRRTGLDLGEGGVHLPRQLAGEVHRAEAVGEAAVLRRGEHPPRALQLVDALEPLHPGVVDDVRFRDLSGVRERDAQVPVERVGDEVDVVVRELHGCHPIAVPERRQGSAGGPFGGVRMARPARRRRAAAHTQLRARPRTRRSRTAPPPRGGTRPGRSRRCGRRPRPSRRRCRR